MTARHLTAILATALSLSGCAAEAPTHLPVPAPRTATPAPSDSVHVMMQPPVADGALAEPVDPATLTDLVVTLPQPAGWEREDNRLAPHTQLISKNHSYPHASLTVYRVRGYDDPAALIRQARTADTPAGFTALNESTADFNDFPSESFEGNFTAPDGHRVHTYHRLVAPMTPASQRYLVELTVTSLVEQTVPHAEGIAEVINGFDIRVK